MRPTLLTRAALATATSLGALTPLAACSSPDPSSSSAETSTSRSAAPSNPISPSSASRYKAGTYKAVGVYGGGPSYLGVTVTIRDNVVTAVTVEPQAENETSRGYQERFAAAVPKEVIGKSLEEAEVGKLAGASTCPDGFNDALAKIREQARTE